MMMGTFPGQPPRRGGREPEPEPKPEPIQVDPEHQKLLGWRRAILDQEGFGPVIGEVLALAVHTDLHNAVRYKRDGATPELVARILL